MTLVLIPAELKTTFSFNIPMPIEKKPDLNKNVEVQYRLVEYFKKKFINYLNTNGKKTLYYFELKDNKLVPLKEPNNNNFEQNLKYVETNLLEITKLLLILDKIVKKSKISWVKLPHQADFVIKLISKSIFRHDDE